MSQAACRSFLTKWELYLEPLEYELSEMSWAHFIGDPEVGLGAILEKSIAGQELSERLITDVVNALFKSESYEEILTPEEARLVLGLYRRRNLAINDEVPMNNCEVISLIASSSDEEIATLPARLEEFIEGYDSEEDDGPPPAMGLTPGPITTAGAGSFALPPSIFPTPQAPPSFPSTTAPSPFQPGTATSLFGGQAVPATPAPSMPNPFGALSAQVPFSTTVGSMIAPPSAQPFPAPSFQPTQIGQPLMQQDHELPYISIACRNFKPAKESKVFMVKIPQSDEPGDFVTVEIFITAGNIPKDIIHTKFGDEEKTKMDNDQKSIIHRQNYNSISKSPIMPTQLSNGLNEKGVCAQSLEAYVASPMPNVEFPMALKCDPAATRVKSVRVPFQAMSGPTPGLFGSTPIQMPTAPKSTRAGPPPTEPTPVNAIPVEVFVFDNNPETKPMIQTHQLPNGPRLIAIGDNWNWFELPGGMVVKSKHKFITLADKKKWSKIAASATRQKEKALQVQAAMRNKFGANYSAVPGAAAPSIPFQPTQTFQPPASFTPMQGFAQMGLTSTAQPQSITTPSGQTIMAPLMAAQSSRPQATPNLMSAMMASVQPQPLQQTQQPMPFGSPTQSIMSPGFQQPAAPSPMQAAPPTPFGQPQPFQQTQQPSPFGITQQMPQAAPPTPFGQMTPPQAPSLLDAFKIPPGQSATPASQPSPFGQPM